MYRINCGDLKKTKFDGEKHFCLTFMKDKFNWKISVALNETFKNLLNILKKFCVLTKFSTDYVILGFLGKGHFAEVYSVENLCTKKKFAAKFLEKNSENFQKNAVLNFIIFI